MKIGEYTIHPFEGKEGSFLIENAAHEHMECSESDLAELLRKFWDEEF